MTLLLTIGLAISVVIDRFKYLQKNSRLTFLKLPCEPGFLVSLFGAIKKPTIGLASNDL